MVTMKIERILDSHGDKLFHYLTIKLGSPLEAEDVLQEVFYRLFKYRMRLRLTTNLKAYLFRTARNEAVNFIKKKRKNSKIQHSAKNLSQVFKENTEGPDQELLNQASEALAEIPENQREVIVFKFFEGLTFKEIAHVCGASMGTITSRYRYGMQKLRSILEE